MESWDWVPASVIYGMGVGGLMFACSVRCESIYEAARKLWNHSRTIMGGSRLVRRRNVPRQIEPLTSTARLRTARRQPDLDSADPEAWTSRQGPARLHGVPVDRPAAVGLRSITSDRLQIRHHRDRDRHRCKPRRAVHRLSYAASSDRKSWVAFVCGTLIASP
jgi:hypothetical protein